MPRSNGEMVLAFLEAINRRDWAAVFADAAPGFEVDLSRAVGPFRGVYTVEDAQRLFADFADSWRSLRIVPNVDHIEGEDYFLGTSTMHVEGRDGIIVTSTVTWVDDPRRQARPRDDVPGARRSTRRGRPRGLTPLSSAAP